MRSLVPLCLALAVPAQTFIVDAASGPGTNFTDLPPAIAAVPNGAILLVRPGTYGPIGLNAKGLSILATAPGVQLAPGATVIHVQNLSATQAFTLRDVQTQVGTANWIALVQNCAGPVLFDGYVFQNTGTYPGVYSVGLRVVGCPQVVLRNCSIRARYAIDALSSAITAEQCELRGQDAFFVPHVGAYPGTGIQGQASNITLSRCRVFGGAGYVTSTPFGPSYTQPGPAISLYTGSSLRLCEDTTGNYQAGQLAGANAIAAIGGLQSTVVRTPEAVLSGSQGGPPVAPALVDIVRPLPSLRVISAPPGGVVTADVTTPTGELVVLAFGLPMPPFAVPGFDGALWLDPTALVVASFGVPLSGQPVTASLAVPLIPSLVGQRFGWQSVAWSPADGFRFGNPSIYAH
jgi:hypothetical protein